MVNYALIAVFLFAWAVIAVLGAVSNMEASVSEASTQIANNAFNQQVVTLDDAPVGGDSSQGIGAVIELPGQATGWVGAFAQGATFRAPFWDGGWSNVIRVLLAGTLATGLIILLGLEALRILASIIPG